jgi:hypothetical protein
VSCVRRDVARDALTSRRVDHRVLYYDHATLSAPVVCTDELDVWVPVFAGFSRRDRFHLGGEGYLLVLSTSDGMQDELPFHSH